MPHTDPEVLALRALGEAAGTPADEQHLAVCPRCRAELGRLAEVVSLARSNSDGGYLESPAPAVWEQIAAATGLPAEGMPTPATGPDYGTAEPAGAEPGGGHAPGGWRRGRRAAVVAGLAAGLVIGAAAGAGITHLASAPSTRVIAQIELRPLSAFPQWRSASGTATMQTTDAGQILDVTLRAPRRAGYYEVWLLARNGVSMISLGDLSASHSGSFTIPAGTDLAAYSRIDVSLQPFDGSTLHSKTSVVRGALPPAATGAASHLAP
jgi:hypothetical protein